MSYALTFRNLDGKTIRVGEVIEYRTNVAGFRHATVTDVTNPYWRSAVPLSHLTATRTNGKE